MSPSVAFDPLLFAVGLAHALVGAACLMWLRVETAPILGVHPAMKPLKFATSIAAFLCTLAVLLPAVSTSPWSRQVISIALCLSMITEMAVIGIQALRGRRSHFNLESTLDAALTRTMFAGIGVLLPTMAILTWLVLVRPLAQPDLLVVAWRSALTIFFFAAVSGFGMGGRGRHSIGGDDGGPGLVGTNWSTRHGDLRVSHFFALHALQVLPLLAVTLSWLPLNATTRLALLTLGIAANALLAGWTWIQALASRPAFTRSRTVKTV